MAMTDRTDKETVALAAQTSETTDANGSAFSASRFKEGAFFLDVSAGTGTSPTLDVDIESKDPVSGNWEVVASFTQATGVTSERIVIQEPLGLEIRAAWAIGGTSPSFDFTVTGVLET